MRLVRYLAFCVFFAVGAGSIALSILIEPELADYYRNKDLLAKNELVNERIEALTGEYEAQIQLIKKDPEVLERLKRVTLGPEQDGEDSVYPEISDRHLAQATAALFEDLGKSQDELAIPEWVRRCAEPRSRMVLFGAGAGLILVGFGFFGTARQIKADDCNEQNHSC